MGYHFSNSEDLKLKKSQISLISDYEDDIYVDSQLSKVFRVSDWSILYPIKREGLRLDIFNPKYCLNVWDYIFRY